MRGLRTKNWRESTRVSLLYRSYRTLQFLTTLVESTVFSKISCLLVTIPQFRILYLLFHSEIYEILTHVLAHALL